MLEKIISMLYNGKIIAYIGSFIWCNIGDYCFCLRNEDKKDVNNFSVDEIAEIIFDAITNWEDCGIPKTKALYCQSFILEN